MNSRERLGDKRGAALSPANECSPWVHHAHSTAADDRGVARSKARASKTAPAMKGLPPIAGRIWIPGREQRPRDPSPCCWCSSIREETRDIKVAPARSMRALCAALEAQLRGGAVGRHAVRSKSGVGERGTKGPFEHHHGTLSPFRPPPWPLRSRSERAVCTRSSPPRPRAP